MSVFGVVKIRSASTYQDVDRALTVLDDRLQGSAERSLSSDGDALEAKFLVLLEMVNLDICMTEIVISRDYKKYHKY